MVRSMATEEMGGPVSVDDGHLNIHKNYVGLRMGSRVGVGGEDVIKGFFAVPDCGNDKAEFLNRFEGNLLIDGTTVSSQLQCSSTRCSGDVLILDKQDPDFCPFFRR